MRRVIGQRRDRFLAVPETQQVDKRVDGAFRLGTRVFILGRAPANVFHVSIRPGHAAVRRNLFDFSFAVSDVRDDARLFQTRLDRLGDSTDRRSGECRIEELVAQSVRDEQLVGQAQRAA